MARPVLKADTMRHARAPSRGRARIAWARPAVLAAVLLACLSATAAAQVRGTVDATVANGFARLVFDFEQEIEQETTVANAVLVVRFGAPVAVDISRLAQSLPGYIAAARFDPDKTTLRAALSARVDVNAIVARDRIYIDLLPENWVGPPPGLPQDVVAELIHLAEEDAEREARLLAGDDGTPARVQIHVGRYPTFSRIVFQWNKPTRTTLSRQEDSVTVTFDPVVELELAELNADPPPRLMSAAAHHGEDQVAVELVVEPGTDVRGFREGSTYVVDLAIDAPKVDLTDGPLGVLPTGDPGGEAVTELSAAGEEPEPDTAENGDAEDAEDLVSITVTPLELENKGDGLAEIGREGAVDPTEFGMVEADPPEPGAEAEAAGEPEAFSEAAGGEEGEARPDVAEADEAMDLDAPPDPNAPVVVEAKVVGSTLRLRFPFVEPVASAAFQRAKTLWVAFDSEVPIVTDAVSDGSEGLVSGLDTVRAAGVQILRLDLTGRYLATSSMEDTAWIVSIGDLVLSPTEPVKLKRALREDGLGMVSAELAGSGRVHWITDEAIGDRLAIITAHGPPRGLIKRQEFVDFTALTTAHGLAIRPHADDLAVRLTQDEVVITRGRGLHISAGTWPQAAAPSGRAASAARPGFVDFEGWRGNPGELLRRKAQTLLEEIARLPEGERANQRLRLVRLYLAHELGFEALGVMRIAEEENSEVVNDPTYRAMRGVTRVMAGRFNAAKEDLLSVGLGRNTHIALWRSLIAASEAEWTEVASLIEEGQPALDAYTPEHQARFLLAGAEAALETGAPSNAARHLEALRGADLDERDTAKRALLQARLAEAQGNDADAMQYYEKLAVSPVRPVAAEAELRRIVSFLRAGRITREAAIEGLESVSVVWRGDRIELAVLRKLAELYAEGGRYRDALETMKIAVVNHESGQLVQLISDDMNRLFNRLLLQGEADAMKPIAALGLYYDFRELTPVGRRGDEMIRKLAHRLVEVDLLDQAADLLDHQVNNRLTGNARAQVAADLSLIQLMARKPELALRAIHQTRQAVLPERLQERRNMLEARALAELGRVEVAVDLLDTMSGPEVERQKAEALWRGERWDEAGEQIERMLGERWQDTAELSEEERLDVLRAAIAYALAEDAIGIERLRRKYITKMAASPDAASFDMVTASPDPDIQVVSELSHEIAAVDTLEAFLEEFRQRYGGGSLPEPAADTGAAVPDTAS